MTRRIGLNFHGIGNPKRVLDPGEAPFWLSEEQFLDVLDRVAGAPEPTRYFLTFDDGNISDFEIALPALEKRGLSATFFVLTGRVGWPGSLARCHISSLVKKGMGIGSHGINHVAWDTLDTKSLSRELLESKAVLEDVCGLPVMRAGIPFGSYNARVLRVLRQCGYHVAFSSDGGRMSDTSFVRPRTSLRGDMGLAELDAVMTGLLPVHKKIYRAVAMTKKRLLPLG